MKIVITMDLDDEYADPAHPMGVTDEAHMELTDALSDYGTDIDITRAEEPA